MPTPLEEKLKTAIEQFESAEARGSSSADSAALKVQALKREVAKEKREKKLPVHPALKFGPISMTVASMAIISLGLSIIQLPREMRAFYLLFSRMTMVAVICLVSYTSVIWYGYNQALAALPIEPTDAEKKLAEFLRKGKSGKHDRADAWAHTRSHPSAFLTTRMAAPRLFPFPMGKTMPEASVKDELWWEGGNAPHVGHFNKPKLPSLPSAPSEETLIARVKKGMEIDRQRDIRKRRIMEVRYLSCVVIVYFVNNKVAILALCVLIYRTLARELDNMLKPPTSLDEVYALIDSMGRKEGRNQRTELIPPPAPRADLKKGKPGGGMTYIHDPSTADRSGLTPSANIPVVQVPAHVLMTSENSWYAGPGDPVKKD